MSKTICTILGILLIIMVCISGVASYRLAETRRLYDDVRVQLDAAESKQRELRNVIRRTDEILCESFDTVAGIRSQIQVIRESYEEMEKLLYGSNANNGSNNDNNNNGEDK